MQHTVTLTDQEEAAWEAETQARNARNDKTDTLDDVLQLEVSYLASVYMEKVSTEQLSKLQDAIAKKDPDVLAAVAAYSEKVAVEVKK